MFYDEEIDNMKNIKLTIEYDGTEYYGWQRQRELATIQGTVENVLEKILSKHVEINGASRTDAGVHARGQVANFLTDSSIPPDRFIYPINNLLPPDIRIVKSEEVPEEFHARYSTKGKLYSYKIFCRDVDSALITRYAAFCPDKLDAEEMAKAAEYLKGTHDFNAFKAAGSSAKTSIRTIYDIRVDKENEIITVYVSGSGFLYNMVRIIAGTLIEVGKDKISPDAIPDILNSKNRTMAGYTAPARGLCLEELYY